MSRESKIFVEEKKAVTRRIKDYESFGWELLSINGTDVSMSRETQNKIYIDLVKYEHNYEELREQLDNLIKPVVPVKFSLGLAFMLLIFFVLPGVLYIVFKILQNNRFKEEYDVYVTEGKKLVNEMKKVCNDSRATFFAKQ